MKWIDYSLYLLLLFTVSVIKDFFLHIRQFFNKSNKSYFKQAPSFGVSWVNKRLGPLIESLS